MEARDEIRRLHRVCRSLEKEIEQLKDENNRLARKARAAEEAAAISPRELEDLRKDSNRLGLLTDILHDILDPKD